MIMVAGIKLLELRRVVLFQQTRYPLMMLGDFLGWLPEYAGLGLPSASCFPHETILTHRVKPKTVNRYFTIQ